MATGERVLIVGGVAGGASCAARLRRLSEAKEITIYERGPYVSFANCGLPYHVGEVIKKERDLLVATPELFRRRFNIQVRLHCEVTALAREAREVEVLNHQTGAQVREPYDYLVLSPGASPIRPPLPGIDLPGIFTLRTIPDSREIKNWISRRQAERAVVVGAGYIGLEMTENLLRRGLQVSLIEMQPQVMPPMDPEMVAEVSDHLRRQGVDLRLGETVRAFSADDEGRLRVGLASGAEIAADMVLLAVGVRPEITLARDAGLEIGSLGGIRVDERMRTSDPRIFAVGDAVEVKNVVTGQWTLMPLAGPANRQGRIAADVICGRPSRFRGVQGTAVLGVLGLTVAITGPSEKSLKQAGLWEKLQAEKVYLHPGHHAGYYPGAETITFKLIFSRKDGRILGAQATGKQGVDKRIDVVALAIQKQGTVFDLEEAELGYAPQYGAAKDPVNLAGMIATNVLRGDLDLIHAEEIDGSQDFLLDVRTPFEYRQGHLDGAVNIPLDELRRRIDEVPKGRPITTYCWVGQRPYYANRLLQQHGLRPRNLSGGYRTYQLWRAAAEEGQG